MAGFPVAGQVSQLPVRDVATGKRRQSRPAERHASKLLICRASERDSLGATGYHDPTTMKYALPLHPPAIVNAAGKALKNFEPRLPTGEITLNVIDNWRAAHNHPLNVFYVTMRARAKRINETAVTAQRIKRMESILGKLLKQRTMHLAQMQDIGGCRAVVRDIASLEKLVHEYESRTSVHQLAGKKDYLSDPKPDGYRSVHLVFRYNGGTKKAKYTGMRIEIQLRTSLQHIWATAVEAAGTFTKQALKSNQGSAEWLRFFACMSSWFAMRENCPPVPGVPTELRELASEIEELDTKLHVVTVLQSFNVTARQAGAALGMKYFLLSLDPIGRTLDFSGFKADQSEEANTAYTELEQLNVHHAGSQAVLVSVDSIKALRRAYPNYFLDTTRFVREVARIVRMVRESDPASSGRGRLSANVKRPNI